MTYYYFNDHQGEWRWLLKAGNGRLIAASGAAYEDEQDCLYDIELVKGSSSSLVKKQAMTAHQ
ncbi:MAG: YegP family protein [Acidobacteriota bacterium]|nr:YegP family protein [Acidobacteriota bacterium]